MFTPELYVRELEAVREALGLERCHVLGHSWGGMLAMLYAIGRPAGLASIVVESSPPSVPFWLGELDRLRADLPPEVESVLRRHEADGTTESDEYTETMMAFYDRHVCRVRPWPDWLQRCFDGLLANPEVYATMNGPSEFHVIGPLKDYDVTASLEEISVPALLFCGEHDEVTPATVAPAHEAIRGSQFVVLPGCSHMSQAERPDLVLGLVAGFLAGVEAWGAGAAS
jgi:L-proline amide hydrolase